MAATVIPSTTKSTARTRASLAEPIAASVRLSVGSVGNSPPDVSSPPLMEGAPYSDDVATSSSALATSGGALREGVLPGLRKRRSLARADAGRARSDRLPARARGTAPRWMHRGLGARAARRRARPARRTTAQTAQAIACTAAQ